MVDNLSLLLCRMTDAASWIPLAPLERRRLALHNLEKIYGGRLGKSSATGKDTTVAELLIEAFDAVWSSSTATGDAMFLPGQWLDRFDACRIPENNDRVFFAGEHISYHHTWISGKFDCSLDTTSASTDLNS